MFQLHVSQLDQQKISAAASKCLVTTQVRHTLFLIMLVPLFAVSLAQDDTAWSWIAEDVLYCMCNWLWLLSHCPCSKHSELTWPARDSWNKDREQLQQDLISSTGQVDELQAQLDELMARLVLMEYWVDMMVDLLAAISRYSRRVWVSPLLSNKN